MKKIVVLFSGAGSNLAYLIEHLHKKKVEIAAAITNNEHAGGIAYAKAAKIPLHIIRQSDFENREAFDKALVETIAPYRPDLVVLAGFMRILTPVFTSRVEAINLHPSLLPRHKGLHAIERSFNDEHDEGGVSVHRVNDELDGGEIILQKAILKEGHDLQSYTDAIKALEKEALSEAILRVLEIE